MINFKYFATKAAYTGATVASDSICFVADEKTIYTHGVAFNGQGSIDLSAYIKGVTVAANDALSASKTSQTVTISHNNCLTTGTAGTAYGPTQTTATNASEGVVIKIPKITVDAKGHVTSVSEVSFTAKDTTYTRNVTKSNAAVSNGHIAV